MSSTVSFCTTAKCELNYPDKFLPTGLRFNGDDLLWIRPTYATWKDMEEMQCTQEEPPSGQNNTKFQNPCSPCGSPPILEHSPKRASPSPSACGTTNTTIYTSSNNQDSGKISSRTRPSSYGGDCHQDQMNTKNRTSHEIRKPQNKTTRTEKREKIKNKEKNQKTIHEKMKKNPK
jgi:hypothetical protein